MLSRSLWIAFLLLILTGVAKASLHFIRLLVLAGAGLAGMYMVHLLAQDWTKIRPNRPAATRLLQSALQGISKRSIPDVSAHYHLRISPAKHLLVTWQQNEEDTFLLLGMDCGFVEPRPLNIELGYFTID